MITGFQQTKLGQINIDENHYPVCLIHISYIAKARIVTLHTKCKIQCDKKSKLFSSKTFQFFFGPHVFFQIPQNTQFKLDQYQPINNYIT